MINVNRLKGKFVENGLTQEDVAHGLGITTRTLQNKLTKETFSTLEIDKLVNILHLTIADVNSIFFAQFGT